MTIVESYIIVLKMITFYRKMHQLFLVITYLEADFTATLQIIRHNKQYDLFENGF